jgi:hypothetical protein
MTTNGLPASFRCEPGLIAGRRMNDARHCRGDVGTEARTAQNDRRDGTG